MTTLAPTQERMPYFFVGTWIAPPNLARRLLTLTLTAVPLTCMPSGPPHRPHFLALVPLACLCGDYAVSGLTGLPRSVIWSALTGCSTTALMDVPARVTSRRNLCNVGHVV